MPRKGLCEDSVVKAAADMVAEKGIEKLSIRELAARLGVKPPALYNHIGGLHELSVLVAEIAVERLREALISAAEGKDRDGSFICMCYAYRHFALTNRELYKSIIRMPGLNDDASQLVAGRSFEPLRKVVYSFDICDDMCLHYMRGIRAFLHGFASLENAGFMHMNPIPLEETFNMMIHQFLADIKAREETEKKANNE